MNRVETEPELSTFPFSHLWLPLLFVGFSIFVLFLLQHRYRSSYLPGLSFPLPSQQPSYNQIPAFLPHQSFCTSKKLTRNIVIKLKRPTDLTLKRSRNSAGIESVLLVTLGIAPLHGGCRLFYVFRRRIYSWGFVTFHFFKVNYIQFSWGNAYILSWRYIVIIWIKH